MSALISLAVAASVLLHSLLGCCMHHGHCCAGDATAETAIEQDACGHCHGGFSETPETAHQGEAAGTAPLDEGHGECEGESCSFLSVGVPDIDLRRDLLAHWVVADLLPASQPRGVCRYLASCASEPAFPPPPPDRPQARLCVWLI